jgi:hypothetical protein
MKSKANLQKAVNILTNVRVTAEIKRQLKGREIVPTGDRMQVVTMPIAEFLAWVSQVGPIQVQRNDAYRLKNNLAKHLSNFQLPQGHFAVIYLDGKFYLVDGNTRKRAWLNCKGLKLPSHVFVNVMIPDSLDEGKLFYDCYDSKQSKKSVRDEITSLLANAGIKTEDLISKLVGGGKLVTVVQHMAREYYARNSRTTRQEIVSEYANELLMLDKLNLDEGVVPTSAVWAALRLYKEVPEGASFITDYMNELAKFKTPSANLVCDVVRNVPRDAREACAAHGVGTSGNKACPVMFPVYLAGFLAYLRGFSKSNVYSKTYMNQMVRKVKDVIESEQT